MRPIVRLQTLGQPAADSAEGFPMPPVLPALPPSRRAASLAATFAAGSVLWLSGCAKGAPAGEDVGAVEDLMREHGILRRILVVYRQAAMMLGVSTRALDR